MTYFGFLRSRRHFRWAFGSETSRVNLGLEEEEDSAAAAAGNLALPPLPPKLLLRERAASPPRAHAQSHSLAPG